MTVLSTLLKADGMGLAERLSEWLLRRRERQEERNMRQVTAYFGSLLKKRRADADAILHRFDYWLGVHKGERYLMANGSRLFNKKELAEALGVARPTLDRWITNGWLEPCRVQISSSGDTLFAANAVREVLITFSNE